ncbi:acyltransferase domain-containing protein [Kitasatospora sp. NBC_01560]|uniref:type I polyketide synthase n=1 Tax=Kitasatospora sp. NBC_01560 TaxID=2975965 RepID=UPI003869650F
MTEPTLDEDSPFLAVVGMAGRFPGAADVDEFWANLCNGVESITRLDRGGNGGPDAGPDSGPGGSPGGAGGYVPAYGLLDDADAFDPEFFGLSQREALITDPQHRLFLECVHQALENAGYDPATHPGEIGLFAGGSTTRYQAALEAQRDALPFLDDWQIRLATAPDFLATRVAHKLRLRGPVATVQSACSTSMVAIHLAAQALLAGECTMALAGGATVHPQAPRGSYAEGGIVTGDGKVRAFDARGAGTVGASAVGVVVLKTLGDALADGDHIHAVLRGTAVNNDGGDKIGFTAPSVDGQAKAIRAAHVVAEVDPATITYVEAHGTGTPLGDPIEVAALTKAFRAGGAQGHAFCALGSVKTNIGHADAAAGVTGFIKAVLCVEHGILPPSLNFDEPNPAIDWARSPFHVVTERTPWRPAGLPRRAGVSALGLGGTNVHAVLEEPPARPARAADGHPQLLPLSARTDAALDAATGRLADRLAGSPELPLGDVARTLQSGRTAHRVRRFAVARDTADAARILAGGEPGALLTGTAGTGPAAPVFLFPGQGSQHVGMARELYAREPEFRRQLDECAALAAPGLGLDLRDVFFPEERGTDPAVAERQLGTIRVSQPAMFVVEYALAALWRSWGVRPAAVVGHSLGAWAAACLAGVFTLPDAVRLVVERGRLMQSLPKGTMLALELPEAEALALLPEGLSVAAVNGPGRCTVSGRAELVERFAVDLKEQGVEARLLHIATAGHSPLVEPIMAEFEAAVAAVPRQRPTIPVLSDTTGGWAGDELTDPAYWSAHLRQPVRFGQALTTLLDDPDRILLEVGPGRTLASLARQHPALGPGHRVVQSLPHPNDEASDHAAVLTAAGRLWLAGVEVGWSRLRRAGAHRRVALPGYPFERRRFLVEPAGPVRAQAPGAVHLGAPGPAAQDAVAAPAASTAGAPSTAGTASEPGAAAPAGAPAAAGPAPADGGPRERIAGAFADILGLSVIDSHENFFDLGGDSLIATRLAAWVREQFAVEFSVRDVFLAPTVAGLTAVVEERLAG